MTLQDEVYNLVTDLLMTVYTSILKREHKTLDDNTPAVIAYLFC